MGCGPSRPPPAQPNQVDIESNLPNFGCVDGFQFEQGQPVPPQLSPYLSQVEFDRGIAQVNDRSRDDAKQLCFLFLCCFLGGIWVTLGIGLFIMCCIASKWGHKQKPYMENVALQSWKAQGLGVEFHGGLNQKQGEHDSPYNFPARIRLTLPMAPQPAASTVGQPARIMQVAIPVGTAPGSCIQMTSPDGRIVQVTVPKDAGSSISVQY